jgi:hypothetical protein
MLHVSLNNGTIYKFRLCLVFMPPYTPPPSSHHHWGKDLSSLAVLHQWTVDWTTSLNRWACILLDGHQLRLRGHLWPRQKGRAGRDLASVVPYPDLSDARFLVGCEDPMDCPLTQLLGRREQRDSLDLLRWAGLHPSIRPKAFQSISSSSPAPSPRSCFSSPSATRIPTKHSPSMASQLTHGWTSMNSLAPSLPAARINSGSPPGWKGK